MRAEIYGHVEDIEEELEEGDSQMDLLPRSSLQDFQRRSSSATEQIGLAYNAVMGLKGAYDQFDEIPRDEMKRYDSVMKIGSRLGKLKQEMNQIKDELRRLK